MKLLYFNSSFFKLFFIEQLALQSIPNNTNKNGNKAIKLIILLLLLNK